MTHEPSPWAGRRVLVTGCTGFLGSAVTGELLAAGAGVVGLVRDRAAAERFARHAVTGRVWAIHGRAEDLFRIHSALAVHEVGAVFHLAATNPHRPDPGAAAVVEAVRRYDPRTPVVIARLELASGGRQPPDGRTHQGADAPRSPIPVGVARFGELFGPGDRKTFPIVSATVLGLLAGNPTPPSAGDTPRDFVHVTDAARACLLLAEHLMVRPDAQRKDVTFRSGWVFTDRAMAAAVREAFAGRAVPPTGPSPANPLGWSPATTFADALAETAAWYRKSAGPRLAEPAPADAPRRAA
ncbi:MAG: NAD(P)-dependent oxidoreductase [Gemmataceae bacterium]|nr:NAD(P)-dependent oxidoreductase [Gemmataceae bacterium]